MYEAKPDTEFVITRGDDAAFYITGKRIERLVAMTNLDDDQSLRRFQRIWRFMELDNKFVKKDVKKAMKLLLVNNDSHSETRSYNDRKTETVFTLISCNYASCCEIGRASCRERV